MCKWVEDIITCNLSSIQKSDRTFQMNGTSKTIYGTMAIASADNAASNALGGFKEGFAALCHCRQCMGNALGGLKGAFTAFRHCRQFMGTAEECKQEVSGPPRTPSYLQLIVTTNDGK